MPVGRRWQRLQRNLPLLFQLIAAILLSLLIAGADLPSERTRRHFTIILDDSASMLAGERESAGDTVRKDLENWADPGDRFTVVAAGEAATLVAGPFADHEQMVRGLKDWNPRATRCDLPRAVELATRFLTEGAPEVLFATDEPLASPRPGLAVHAVGQPLENVAIDYADRAPDGPERDRIHAVIRLYGSLARRTTLDIKAGDEVLARRELELEPGVPVSLAFPTGRIAETIRLELPGDTLAIDNLALLAPLERKVVSVAGVDLGAADMPLRRAVAAIPESAMIDDSTQARLVFTAVRDYQPTGAQIRAVVLPPSDTQADRAIEGRDIVAVPGHPATDALPLEGVVWAAASDFPRETRELLYNRDLTLLSASDLGADRATYRLNLVAGRSNVFRQTGWPVLVQGLIEETRDALPGMGRTNVRAGQDIEMRLPVRGDLAKRFELRKMDGASNRVVETWAEAPRAIPAPAPGLYRITQGGKAPLAEFAVNFFASAESDLRPRATRRADLKALAAQDIDKGESSRLVYYLLLAGILASAALAWIFQDISR